VGGDDTGEPLQVGTFGRYCGANECASHRVVASSFVDGMGCSSEGVTTGATGVVPVEVSAAMHDRRLLLGDEALFCGAMRLIWSIPQPALTLNDRLRSSRPARQADAWLPSLTHRTGPSCPTPPLELHLSEAASSESEDGSRHVAGAPNWPWHDRDGRAWGGKGALAAPTWRGIRS
jgi:hypothetical protein